MGKLIRRLKGCGKKASSIAMSMLMLFSCVNVAGIQPVFAETGTNQVTIGGATSYIIGTVWDIPNTRATVAGLGTVGGTRVFSLTPTLGTNAGTLYMDVEDFGSNRDNIKQAMNWYYQNTSEENFWIAQTLIWGYAQGKINVATDSKANAAIKTVLDAVSGVSYDTTRVNNAIAAINGTGTEGDYYVYTGESTVAQLAGNSAGAAPTFAYATTNEQVSNQSIKENVLVRAYLKDADNSTATGLNGATFQFYKDGILDSTVTTNKEGIAEVTFSETISQTVKVTKQWCTNYNALSPKNKAAALADGKYYTNQTEAIQAAAQEAKDTALELCYASNSGAHTYKVVQKNTREGYYLNEAEDTQEKSYTVVSNSENDIDGTVNFEFSNQRQRGNLTVTKQDTDKKTTVKGAVYGLYAAENIYTYDGTNDGQGTLLHHRNDLVAELPATDVNGVAQLNNIELGKYYLKEIEAPDGYKLSDETYEVVFNPANSSVHYQSATEVVNDQIQKGTITILKQDDETEFPITGATFDLYAAEDITYPDGKSGVIYEKDEKVGSFSATDEDGMTSLSDLYLGTYYAVETSTIAPYYRDQSRVTISLDYAGQEVEVAVKKQLIDNHRQECRIVINQRDSETRQPVAGAVYEVYAGQDIYRQSDGKLLYKKDQLVTVAEPTGNDGVATVDGLYLSLDESTGNYLSKYYVVQKKAPNGYVYAENRQELTFEYAGQTININSQNASGENKVQRGSIQFNKVDSELHSNSVNAEDRDTNNDGAQADATIQGAVYGLYAAEDIVHKDGHTGNVSYDSVEGSANQIVLSKGTDLNVIDTDASAGSLLATAKTDKNGDIKFEHLYLGKYYIKEITPSEGYTLDTNRYDVSLDYQGQDRETFDTEKFQVQETVIKQAITIKKVGVLKETQETISALPDVHFQIKLESDIQALVAKGTELEEAIEQAPLYQEIVTDQDGLATSIELPYGTYRIIEVIGEEDAENGQKSPAVDYVPSEDTFVTITEDSRTPKDLTNNPIKNNLFDAKVQVKKIDAESGKVVKLPDAEFKIKVASTANGAEYAYCDGRKFAPGDYVGYYTLDALEGFYKDTWTTDEDGFLEIGKKLSAGTYYLEEINAPEGYTLNSEYATFTISTEGVFETDEEGNAIFTALFKDEPVKGQIEVSVTGDVLKGFEDGDFTYESQTLGNAKFNIVAARDIMDPSNDGTVLYEEGEVVETVTTKRDSQSNEYKIVTSKLPLGWYNVEQISAPHGYVVNTEPQLVKLEYIDQKEKNHIVKKSVSFENDRQKYEVSTTKLDKETDAPVAGAEFTLYADEDIYAPGIEEPIVTKDTAIAKAVSNDSGKATFDIYLPCDIELYEKETKAPLGYVSTTQREDFNTNYTNDKEALVKVENTFKNAPTTIESYKFDSETHVMPAGNQMRITDSEGSVVDSWTTEQGKAHVTKRLHVGETYHLQEVLAADGYLNNLDGTLKTVDFVVKDVEEPQIVEMEDDKQTGTITITKKGEVLDGFADGQFTYKTVTFEGASFNIYAAEDIKHPDNETADYYKQGDLVASNVVTKADGTVSVEGLPLGEYTIVETVAPEGLVLDSTPISAELNYAGQAVAVSTTSKEKFNERQKIALDITKLDKETQEKLEGAEFTMYANKDIVNHDGEVIVKKDEKVSVAVSDKDGLVVFDIDLPIDLDSTTSLVEDGTGIIHGNPNSMFYIKETARPHGYASIKDIVYVDTSYSDQNTGTNVISFVLYNEQTKATFTLTDPDKDVGVAGSVLTIYAVNDDDSIGEEIAHWTTDGQPHVVRKLEPGKYVLRHTLGEAAKNGYVTSEDLYFTIEDTPDMQYINMDVDHTVVSIDVKDYEGNPLAGGTYKIVSVDDETRVWDEWESQSTDAHITEYLPTGEYKILAQITAPEGYVIATEMEILIKDDRDVQNFTIVDKQYELVLTDAHDNPISGGFVVTDEDGETVDSFTTTGNFFIRNLKEGHTYTVHQSAVAAGYVGAQDQTIVVTEDKATQTVEFVNQRYSYMAQEENGKTIEGIQIEVTDENGTVVDSWTTDDTVHYISGMREGHKYTLKQVSVPAGYVTVLDREIDIPVLENDEKQDVVLTEINPRYSFASYTCEENPEDRTMIAGVEMEVIDAEGDVVDTFVTTSDAVHYMSGLTEGQTYTLHQVSVPDGYVIADDITFDVLTDKKDKDITMQNERVFFNKTNVGEDATLIEGAEMEVRDENGAVVDSWTSDGTTYAISGLAEGKNYTLVEVNAPEGFVIAEPVQFTTPSDKTDMTIGMQDKQVTLSVVDTKDPSSTLAGVTFEVKNAKGEVVDTWTSDTEPHAIDGLVEGETYTIAQTAVPEGYVMALPQELTVSKNKENQSVLFENKQVFHTTTDVAGNALENVTIEVTDENSNVVDTWVSGKEAHAIKGLVEGKEYTVTETQVPEGYVTATPETIAVTTEKVDQAHTTMTKQAFFSLTDKENQLLAGAEINVVDAEGNTVDTWTTGEDNHAISGLVEGQTYTIKEAKAPQGFVIALDIPVEITAEKVNQSVVMVNKQVLFSKTDVTGNEMLADAQIEVVNANGEVVDSFTTTTEAIAVNGLAEGQHYTFNEIASPETFAIAQSVEMDVTSDKEDQPVAMSDKQVSIVKVDSATKENVEGATLAIYEVDENGNKAEEAVDTFTTTKDAYFTTGLVEGKTYVLSEIEVPEGYAKADDVQFTVEPANEDGIKENQEIIMSDMPLTTIQVNKVDSQTKDAITGKDFAFTIYSDEECKEAIATVHANTAEGTASFERVEFGTYFIKETQAPKGYQLSDEVVKVVVDENLENVGKVYEFDYENTLIPAKETTEQNSNTPKTGDSNMIAVAGAMAVASVSVIALLSKKKKEADAE